MKKTELKQLIKEEIMKIKEMSLQSSDITNFLSTVKSDEVKILDYLDFNSIKDLTTYLQNSSEEEFNELERELEDYKKNN